PSPFGSRGAAGGVMESGGRARWEAGPDLTMDERCARRTRRVVRSNRPYRRRNDRESDRVGSRRDTYGRAGASRAAAQAHAVCWTNVARYRSDDVSTRPARVGSRESDDRCFRTRVVKDLIDLASERLGGAVIAANDD